MHVLINSNFVYKFVLKKNWLSSEKSHFMVQDGIILGYQVSKHGLTIDKAKIEVIKPLLLPIIHENAPKTS